MISVMIIYDTVNVTEVTIHETPTIVLNLKETKV